MNPLYQSLLKRKSVRIFEDKPIHPDIKEALLNAAFHAPTAGNQMLYSIIDVSDQTLKNKLSETCDHQAFIAKAPLVFVFLADTQRWYDAYLEAGIDARKPGVGDILLAIEDTMIAAQNMVIAAESFSLGSCYIGDILENAEEHIKLLNLSDYVIPIGMLVIGYPIQQQKDRIKPTRFDAQYIVHENSYRQLSSKELRDMFKKQGSLNQLDFEEFIHRFYDRKYGSDFAQEMTRSSEVYLKKFIK